MGHTGNSRAGFSARGRQGEQEEGQGTWPQCCRRVQRCPSNPVSLESMKPGERCPCGKGNLYEIDDSPLVRIVGQAPLHADVYRLERLRCNTCGDVFTAKAPEGIGTETYDATSTAMVALVKYGS